MNSYLSLVSKYLSAHKNKTKLVITGVAIAVALVTGIFSMLDSFLQFQKIQKAYEYGNYHLSVTDATDEQKQAIAGRIDVRNSGTLISFKKGSLNGKASRIAALDENFAPNFHLAVKEGSFPAAADEIMLEEWAAESLDLKVGDRVGITFSDNSDNSENSDNLDNVERRFLISGIFGDYANTKASGVPGVYLSVAGAEILDVEKTDTYLIEFKGGVNVNNAQKAIQSSLNLTDGRIGRNEMLLAVMGQGKGNTIMGIYATSAVLFCIVLIAGVMMIYNTFNISVMERVRQFGLLRCIGASPSQIKKLVKREGLHIVLRAVPIGVIGGMLLAFICSSILKFYNSSFFGGMPLFNVSLLGIIAGMAIGILTVSIASSLPAKKAARVSPVSAVTGSSRVKIPKKKKLQNQQKQQKQQKQGLLTKLLKIEIAMGINNAAVRKKTLLLMSSSIAISIVIFLGFQVFVDYLHSSLKTTKPYTPDIVLSSEQGIDHDLYEKLSALDGTRKVYGRMHGYVDATFDASRLTEDYKKIIGEVSVTKDGLFVPREKSWLVSYDDNQLKWAKTDLIDGELSEQNLNEHNGVIVVAQPLRKGVGIQTAALKPGDKVYIRAPGATKQMQLKVMAVLRTVPFSSTELTMTTFITTEKLYAELMGESPYKVINVQLERSNQFRTVSAIKNMLDNTVSLLDQRQKNAETDGFFLTAAVFIYGFVAVIALISVLNIINTMNTSVASKIRYLGVVRAVGMSGAQLDRMVLAEAVTHTLTGCIAGILLGVALQKALIANYLPRLIAVWKFPSAQIGLILVMILLTAAVSVIGPLKRIKSRGISEVIGSL